MSGTGDTAAAHGADDEGTAGAAAPSGRGAGPVELPEYAERVLGVAELIPAGRVMTYGDVAEWLAGEEPPAARGASAGPGRWGG